jgi:hypothetical protein
MNAIRKAIAEVAGAELGDRYRSGPWSFPSGEELGAIIEGAGFEEVRVLEHVLPITFEGGPGQLASAIGASALAADINALSAEDRQRIVDGIARRLGDGPVHSKLTSNVALARR